MSKDQALQLLVEKEIDRLKESGQYETIEGLLYKIPKSRFLKERKEIAFDQIRHTVENAISVQQTKRIKKIEESRLIRNNIQLNLGKAINEAATKSDDGVLGEKLKSGDDIKKSLRYLKNQESLKLQSRLGGEMNSFAQLKYIKVDASTDFDHTRLLMGESQIRMLYPLFKGDSVVEFQGHVLPNQLQLQKRAQILAKLFLLDVFKTQIPIQEMNEKLEYQEKQREIEMERMKQKIEEERRKIIQDKVEDLEENDLLRQVRKIEGLLDKKMNLKSFQHFQNKEYDESVRVKKSLEKMHRTVKEIGAVQDKLKYLIRYKQEKGY